MLEIDRVPKWVRDAVKEAGVEADGAGIMCFSDRSEYDFSAEVYLFANGDTLSVVKGLTVLTPSSKGAFFGSRGTERSFKVQEIKTFVTKNLKNARVEERLSGGILIAEYEGDTVQLAVFSHSVRSSVAIYARHLNRLSAGEEIHPDEIERVGNGYCPKCGTRYPDQNRRVCPNCMNKDQLFRRIWVFLKRYKGALALTLLSLTFLTAMSIISPYLSKGFFFDEVIYGKGKFAGQLLLVLGLIVATKALSSISSVINNWVTSKVAANMVFDLKRTIFSSIDRLSISFFLGRQTGGLMTQVNEDSSTIYSFFCDGVPTLLINVVQVAVLSVLLFIMNPLLALLSLLTIPFFIFVLKAVYKAEKKYYARRYSHSKRVNSTLADVFSGMRVVKAFSKEKKEYDRFNGQSRRFAKAGLDLSIFNAFSWPLSSVLLLLGNSVAWGVGGYMVMKGYNGMTYGTLLTFTAYMNMIYSPMIFFTNVFNQAADCANALQRLFEIMDAQPDVVEKENAVAVENLGNDVVFDHVNFSYIKGKKIIKDVSFSVPGGGVLGIVGHTGAGKSTLANLLLRLYDADEGEIRIGGYPVKDLKLESIYRQIAIVSQETYLFMGTILDNIRYAKPDASYEEVITAARCAGAHDFIMKFPDAYQTRIGSGGQELSGGEKQRISIARAILKNPKILVLDEATAAMDTQTERKIQSALEELIRGKTTIMIAHRLSTLRSADYLIVMEHGKIVEEGTHEALLEKENGVYQKLYRLQTEALRNAGVIEED